MPRPTLTLALILTQVTDMADKESKIEVDKAEMVEKWEKEALSFKIWKDRGVPVLQMFAVMMDELDEATMMTQTMLTMKAGARDQDEVPHMTTAAHTSSDSNDHGPLFLTNKDGHLTKPFARYSLRKLDNERAKR